MPTVTQRTYVVLGAPRGGTSLIAGALHAAGIYMGQFATGQYEDIDFKIAPADVKRGLDVTRRLSPIIERRNQQHRYWGWKLPNTIYYIEQVQHLLINPVFLFVYRDQESIARSSAKHDKKRWWLHRRQLRRVARNHTQLVQNFEQSLDLSIAKARFQVEDIHKDVPRFVEQLATLVQPYQFDKEAVTNFINPNGGYATPNAAS